MAMPHAEAAALAARAPGRTSRSSTWAPASGSPTRRPGPRFYGGEHAGHWTYGLPELPGARERIRASARVAAPGCYATASILALAPLLASGLAEPSRHRHRRRLRHLRRRPRARASLMGSEVMGAMSAYKVGGVHRHTPEIEEALQGVLAPDGRPRPAGHDLVHPDAGPDAARHPRHRHRAPGRPGARRRGRGTRRRPPDALREAVAGAYAGEPFVHLLPEGQWPSTGATAGSNAAQLQAAADAHAGRAVVVAAIDNLGKGAAGQALQNANLMLGLPESAGLTAYGVAP